VILSSLIQAEGVHVVNLIALPPCAGLLPMSEGGIEVTEALYGQLMSVVPFAGRDKAVSGKLKELVGTGLPGVNRRVGNVWWFGYGTWMVAGDVALDGVAAVTDQTDAWAVVQIAGGGVEDVLARLVPIDLRTQVFKKNHVAKTMLGHMSVAVTRVGAASFEIMVMRSMAATLIHELQATMRGVAARNAEF
jgi:sarcosine oxidase subunit gamma